MGTTSIRHPKTRKNDNQTESVNYFEMCQMQTLIQQDNALSSQLPDYGMSEATQGDWIVFRFCKRNWRA
jgi:hypothetical protein